MFVLKNLEGEGGTRSSIKRPPLRILRRPDPSGLFRTTSTWLLVDN